MDKKFLLGSLLSIVMLASATAPALAQDAYTMMLLQQQQVPNRMYYSSDRAYRRALRDYQRRYVNSGGYIMPFAAPQQPEIILPDGRRTLSIPAGVPSWYNPYTKQIEVGTTPPF